MTTTNQSHEVMGRMSAKHTSRDGAVKMKPLYLTLEEVADVVALSETTIQEEIRQGRFPQPRALSGRRVGWLVREVKE